MPNIVVSGLPENVKKMKLLYVFKNIFDKKNIQDFWLQGIFDMPCSNLKKAVISFSSFNEAHAARNLLDQYMYYIKGETYLLRANMEDDDYKQSKNPHNSRDSRISSQRSRLHFEDRIKSRSRSPTCERSSKLDMEFELLRKERLVIEEERRLLLEKKKLELIKEFGPLAVKEFTHIEEPHPQRRSRETERHREGRNPRMLPSPKSSSQHKIHRHKKYKHEPLGAQIPQFILPCKKLISEMKQHIYNDKIIKKESTILVQLIRSTLRKRLALALESKKHMTIREIIVLYRSLYPKTEDKTLIRKLLGTIRASHLPVQNIKNIKREDVYVSGANEPEVKKECLYSNKEQNKSNHEGNKEYIDKKLDIATDSIISLNAKDVDLTPNKDDDSDWIGWTTDWDDVNED